jgi:hypothetical protein
MFFKWKSKIDKRGHLQWFIQGSGKHTQEGFKFERQRILLKATCLSIHYYNTIEQVQGHYNSNLKQQDMTRYKQLLGMKTCCQANYSKTSQGQLDRIDISLILLSAT